MDDEVFYFFLKTYCEMVVWQNTAGCSNWRRKADPYTHCLFHKNIDWSRTSLPPARISVAFARVVWWCRWYTRKVQRNKREQALTKVSGNKLSHLLFDRVSCYGGLVLINTHILSSLSRKTRTGNRNSKWYNAYTGKIGSELRLT